MSNQNYNKVVDARSRAAEYLLSTESSLNVFQRKGGLPRDLQTISSKGREAEAHNLAQASAGRNAVAATAATYEVFKSLHSQWLDMMAVLDLVTHDLVLAKAPQQAIKAVEGIRRNEAEMTVVTFTDKDGKAGRRKVTQSNPEALRAEMAKDLTSLLALLAVDKSSLLYTAAEKLRERPAVFDETLLKKNLTRVESLRGLLTAKDGGKKCSMPASKAEREAVKAQSQVWDASYRILKRVAEQDAELRGLLVAARSHA